MLIFFTCTLPENKAHLSYEHTERQHQWQYQWQAAAAVSPMQIYGDASLDAPNGSQIHFGASPYT